MSHPFDIGVAAFVTLGFIALEVTVAVVLTLISVILGRAVRRRQSRLAHQRRVKVQLAHEVARLEDEADRAVRDIVRAFEQAAAQMRKVDRGRKR